MIAVVPFTWPTSGATFDITDAGKLGGATPVGAIFIMNAATAEDSEAAGAIVGIGWTDGSNGGLFATKSRDGVATNADGNFRLRSANCIGGGDDEGSGTFNVTPRGSFNSWLTNGVRINVNAGTTARRGIAIFFFGTGVQCWGESANQTNSTSVDKTAPNFEPNFVLGVTGAGSIDLNLADAHFCFGAAISSAMRSMTAAENDNSAPAGRVRIGNAEAISHMQPDGSIPRSWGFESFDSQGFTLTRSGSGNAPGMTLFAVRDPNVLFRLVDFQTPTTTGVHSSITGLDIEPEGMLGVLTSLEARNVAATVPSDALSASFSLFAADLTTERALTQRWDIGAATTDTGSLFSTHALHVSTETGTTDVAGEVDSFTVDGVDFDYATVASNPKMGWALVWGQAAVTPAATGLPLFILAGG